MDSSSLFTFFLSCEHILGFDDRGILKISRISYTQELIRFCRIFPVTNDIPFI